MTLQRRLLIYLLITAPLVWAIALSISVLQARHEVNELFDTEMIRLARQLQVLAPSVVQSGEVLTQPAHQSSAQGESDLNDLSIAVWDARGGALVLDREGVQLPWQPNARGFVDLSLESESWRIYYLPVPTMPGVVATGQRLAERDELVWGLVGAQLGPWILVLPVLLLAMGWAVRQALAPVRSVAQSLHARSAQDLARLPLDPVPTELQPLIQAMNALFERIESGLERERRFTADAAHELRTPIAVLSAQWAVVQGAQSDRERAMAAANLSQGLTRASRLIEQLLSLSKLESQSSVARAQGLAWTSVIEEGLSDVLPLAERRCVELAVEWGFTASEPARGLLDFRADASLMTLLIRNLIDNAVRYAPPRSTVLIRLGAEALTIENETEQPVSAQEMAQWGIRFHRADGQQESGSGLGVSIAQRIAQLHGLHLTYELLGPKVVAKLTEQPPPEWS